MTMAAQAHRPAAAPPTSPLHPSFYPGAACSRRQPRSGRAAARHTARTLPSAPTQQEDAAADEDGSPLCVVLPNGRQFQIQVLVRSGRQPEWSFSGLPGMLPSHGAPFAAPMPAAGHQPPLAFQQQRQRQRQQQQRPAFLPPDEALRIFHPKFFIPGSSSGSNAANGNSSSSSGGGGGSSSSAARLPGVSFLEGLGSLEDAPGFEPADALAWSLTEPSAASPAAATVEAEESLLAWSFSEEVAAAPAYQQQQQERSRLLSQQQQQLEQLLQRQQQLEHAEQQQPQQLPGRLKPQQTSPADAPEKPLPQQQQQQQTQQRHLPFAADSPQVLHHRISAAQIPWDVSDVVIDHHNKFTPALTAAALTKLEQLLSWRTVQDLQHGIEGSNDSYRRGRHTNSSATDNGPRGRQLKGWRGPVRDSIATDSSTTAAQQQRWGSSDEPASSSSSSSDDSDDADLLREQRRPSLRLKLLMRCYFRLIDRLEEIGQGQSHGQGVQGCGLPAAALVAAARLAARLAGPGCPVHGWWVKARGYQVLGLAALEFQAGRLSLVDAIDICYSYQHSGYEPGVLLGQLLAGLEAQQQPDQQWANEEQQQQWAAEELQQLGLRRLCRLTFCAISSSLPFNRQALAAAILAGLVAAPSPDPATAAAPGTSAYDTVMLLRHMCQLSPEPPQGLEQMLVPRLLLQLPGMTMQELSTVLHVAAVWQLDCRTQLAAAAAQLVAAAAGVSWEDASSSDHESRQQQDGAWQGVPQLLVDRHQQLQEQLARALQQEQGEVAETDTAEHWYSGSSSATGLQQQLAELQQQAAAWRVATAAPPPAAAAADRTRRQDQHRRRQLQQRLPRTAADPVFLLLRLSQCSYQPPPALQHWLLRHVGPHLHRITLLQACLLRPALMWSQGQGRQASGDPAACEVLLQAALAPWLVSSSRSSSSRSAGDSNGTATTAAAVAPSPELWRLPYWQLKALLVAAGRFGVLAGGMQDTQQQPGQQQPDILASSSSGSGGRSIAVTFVSAILSDLECALQPATHAPGRPAPLASWRADMALALLWAAARLQLRPSDVLLQAGMAALAKGMRSHIGSKELVHLAWVAAVLQLKEPRFSRVLCWRLEEAAGQLHPKSLAGAAWSLVQLRYPNTSVLTAFSNALLSPKPLVPSYQRLHNKAWQRQPPQQSQRRSAAAAAATAGPGAAATRISSGRQLLEAYPRVALLDAAAAAKLASSCVLAGWVPPQLLVVLGLRAAGLMRDMQPGTLAQLLWAYGAARCRHDTLLFAAVERAGQLAASGCFEASRQALTVLGAFRAMGLASSTADAPLAAEVARLKAMEAAQQGQQPA